MFGSNWTPDDIPDMKGKVALVTGGSDGIGFQIVSGLAKKGCRVLFASNQQKIAQQALDALKEDIPGAQVEWKQVDLASLKDTKRLGDEIADKEKRLDLLINDAGIGVRDKRITTDGIDEHFEINHLSHMLLVNRLLPTLKSTSKSLPKGGVRVLEMSSSLHQAARGDTNFSIAELTAPVEKAEVQDGTRLYGRSKLAMILFIKQLQSRVLEPTNSNILTFTVHPGAVSTGQQSQLEDAYGLFGKAMATVMRPLIRSPERGAQSMLWAATSADVLDKSGSYISDVESVGGETSQADDEELGKTLWSVSEQLIKQKLGQDALLPWT